MSAADLIGPVRVAAPALVVPLLVGCGDGTGPVFELPWNPDGAWEVEVTGTLWGEPHTDTLRVHLLTGLYVTPEGSSATLVSLAGSWKWGIEEGPLDGFWWAGLDEDAATGGECPGAAASCSVKLRLRPEIDVCTDAPLGATPLPIVLDGWFEGQGSTIVGASFEGTFWDFQNTPPPCEGDVVVSFDTPVELTRPAG